MSVALVKYFTKVYNRCVSVDWDFISKIERRSIFKEIAGLMTPEELNESLFRLTWHKSPGSNGVSPNAIKSLCRKYRIKLLKLITMWLKDEDFIYESWQSAALKVLPKRVIFLTLTIGVGLS